MSLKCFIGYDPRQPIAFQVCAHSIWEHASQPVEIIRLDLRTLPITRRGLTEFTYSRFLVPWLCGYKGHALFLDSDILVREDIFKIMDDRLAEEERLEEKNRFPSVYVVNHERKFERPSVMLFVNYCCEEMTPEYVENPANKLFDFAWAKDVGDLPKEWNHLVGYDAPNPDAKIVHFTMGVPVWPETAKSEFASEWMDTFRRMNSTVSFQELMGRSVHLPHLHKVAQ